jgi:energy-coupling factor transporter ATP-binding protein EcfA2
MVKLKRLKIEKYRNVKPGTELRFRDSLNVLLGRNGAGKTTLLNLVAYVLSGNFEPLKNELFALEYDLEVSEGNLTVRLRNESRSIPSGLAVPDDPKLYTSRLDFDEVGEILLEVRDSGKRYLLRTDKTVLLLKELESEKEYELRRPRSLFDGYMMVEFMAALWEMKAPEFDKVQGVFRGAVRDSTSTLSRFDESLGYLERFLKSEGLYDVVKPRREGRFISAGGGWPEPIGRLLEKKLDANPALDELRIRDDDPRAGFLARMIQLLGFRSAELKLQRTAHSTDPYEEVVFGGARFYFVRQDGSGVDGAWLSYGQKRLLGFYLYLASNPACAVTDELVNGMHHEWIDACLADLGERQSFLTSQNPLLLDYLGFESAEEVRSSFVLCRTELHDGREQMVWENMTAEDAEGFFKAYQVGIQHVSELLRTRGLW